jgi:hypothetical protein
MHSIKQPRAVCIKLDRSGQLCSTPDSYVKFHRARGISVAPLEILSI